jgi:hypothetical protein
MFEQAGYKGPGRDRQRKAETGRDKLEQAGYIVPGRDRQRKAETSRDMLGQAVNRAWQE